MRTAPAAVGGLVAILIAANGTAQEAQSPRLVQELAQLLQQRGLDSIAAPHPDEPDRFVAALHFPETQMLAISARCPSPEYLREQIAKGEYREAYMLLNSISSQEGRFFVQDLAADGLHVHRSKDDALDLVYESVVNRTSFDGDWKAQGLTEAEYKVKFKAADEQYTKMLSALISGLRAAAPR
jgi:hypothetical protein